MLPANILQSQLLLFQFSRQVAAVQEKEPPVLVLLVHCDAAGIHPRMLEIDLACERSRKGGGGGGSTKSQRGE